MLLSIEAINQASVDSIAQEHRLAIDQGALLLMSNTVRETEKWARKRKRRK